MHMNNSKKQTINYSSISIHKWTKTKETHAIIQSNIQNMESWAQSELKSI